MTREEAIDNLYTIKDKYTWSIGADEALDMAIEALRIFTDNATNGDVIKALFPNGIQIALEPIMKYEIGDYAYEFSYKWWNAPYKSESDKSADTFEKLLNSGVLDGRKQIMKMHEDFIKGIEKLKFDIDTEFEKPLDEIPKINRKAYLNDWL